MKVVEASDGSLTITAVTWWPALVTIAFGVAAVQVWLRDPPRRGDGFWSALLVVAALACLAGLERGRFRFDRAARRLTWERRRPFRREGGDVPFDAIHGISLEQAFDGESGRRSNARRIDLHTDSGVVPLTLGYGGGSGEMKDVAERIRRVVGMEGRVVV